MKELKKYCWVIFAISLFLMSCAKPVANFTFADEKKEAPAMVQFENLSQNAETYEWDFGDGNFSTGESPEHRYNSSGNYLVQLKAQKGKKARVAEKRLVINAPLDCLVDIETEYGNMLVKLYNDTPLHQDNFAKLVEKGFYDGLLFHRVIEGFMIQGGDPQSRNAKAGQPLGGGGPGYQIPAEIKDNLIHVKGALAAARQGDQINPKKQSSGSQFYIVQGKPITEDQLHQMETRKGRRYTKEQRDAYLKMGGTPFLDGQYTVFGQVIEGLNVIDKIASAPTGPNDRPIKDVKFKIRIIN